MPTEEQLDVGALPDSPAPVGTPEESAPDITAPEIESSAPDGSVEGKTISDAPDEGEISEDIKSEMQSVIEGNTNDSALVKKLRDLVKVKYEDFASRVTPEIPESQKEALELVNGLFEFDVERGVATTRNFATKLAEKDLNLATQAFEDLSSIPVNANGYTLGHKFLESIGLDPYKIEELRQFSRGELNATDYGIVQVHAFVPKELSEAYKSLDPVTRTDVDVYLDSENEAQKAAALRTLRNQQAVLDNERYTQQRNEQQQQQFTTEVAQATENDLTTTYTGVLSSIKSNPAYTSVTISSDPNVDGMLKDSIISQLNALGDPRSVLAKQAASLFEARGIKVDMPKLESLMQTIETSTKTAITAEKMGKLQGRDYSTQIQDAVARKSQAVSALIAMGNKYFSQALSNLSGVKPNTPNPKGGTPPLDGNPASFETRPTGVKTPAELDAEILNIAKTLRAAQ